MSHRPGVRRSRTEELQATTRGQMGNAHRRGDMREGTRGAARSSSPAFRVAGGIACGHARGLDINRHRTLLTIDSHGWGGCTSALRLREDP